MTKYFFILLLACNVGFANDKGSDKIYDRQWHYNLDIIFLSTFTGLVTTANYMKSENADQKTLYQSSVLAGLISGILGWQIAQTDFIKMSQRNAKILFPLMDAVIYGIIGFYSGAWVGHVIMPQEGSDLPVGALLGGLIGGGIGAPTGGIVGYKLVMNF